MTLLLPLLAFFFALLLVGGAACLRGVGLAGLAQRQDLRYDGEDPRP